VVNLGPDPDDLGGRDRSGDRVPQQVTAEAPALLLDAWSASARRRNQSSRDASPQSNPSTTSSGVIGRGRSTPP
jgi:hypothetical protein